MISDLVYTFHEKEIPEEYDGDLLPSFAVSLFTRIPKHTKLTLTNIVRCANKDIDENSYLYINRATVQSSIPFLIQGGFVSVEMGIISLGVMGESPVR